MDGFPHSAIQGSQLVCSSPWLIAAYHGLHRLRVPRHPRHTFFRLIRFLTQTNTTFITRNLTNDSVLLACSNKIAPLERDEIESVLILELQDLIRSQSSNPTITTTFDCQTTVPLRA